MNKSNVDGISMSFLCPDRSLSSVHILMTQKKVMIKAQQIHDQQRLVQIH